MIEELKRKSEIEKDAVIQQFYILDWKIIDAKDKIIRLKKKEDDDLNAHRQRKAYFNYMLVNTLDVIINALEGDRYECIKRHYNLSAKIEQLKKLNATTINDGQSLNRPKGTLKLATEFLAKLDKINAVLCFRNRKNTTRRSNITRPNNVPVPRQAWTNAQHNNSTRRNNASATRRNNAPREALAVPSNSTVPNAKCTGWRCGSFFTRRKRNNSATRRGADQPITIANAPNNGKNYKSLFNRLQTRKNKYAIAESNMESNNNLQTQAYQAMANNAKVSAFETKFKKLPAERQRRIFDRYGATDMEDLIDKMWNAEHRKIKAEANAESEKIRQQANNVTANMKKAMNEAKNQSNALNALFQTTGQPSVLSEN